MRGRTGVGWNDSWQKGENRLECTKGKSGQALDTRVDRLDATTPSSDYGATDDGRKKPGPNKYIEDVELFRHREGLVGWLEEVWPKIVEPLLAAADPSEVAGMFTGEAHPVPLPPNFSARVDDWFPDSSHLLVTKAEQPGKAGLWSVSVFGGSPRQLANDASGGSLSPDGAHIAFRRGALTYDGQWGREEWVMRSDGRATAGHS